MTQILLHPLPVRVWHWVNAASFLVLIVTGIQIRYRDIMHMMSFETAVDVHNAAGFVVVFNYLLWLAYYLRTGKIRIYLPEMDPRKLVRGLVRQARYYGHGIFMGEDSPHHSTPDNKFNPLQKMSYLGIMTLLLPMQMASGLLLWDVKLFVPVVAVLGGIKTVASIHVILNWTFISFLFVHVYLTTLGHTPLEHAKAMLTGYEEAEEAPSP